MIRTTVVIAASLLATVAVPAYAEAPSGAKPTDAAASRKASDDQRRYCIMSEQTGSRIATKVCRTREEWRAAGIDISMFTAR